MEEAVNNLYMEAADLTASSLQLDEAQRSNLENFYFTDLQFTDRFRQGLAKNTDVSVGDVQSAESQAQYRFWAMGEYLRKNPDKAEMLKTPNQTYQLLNDMTLGDEPLLQANSLAKGEAQLLLRDFEGDDLKYSQNLLGIEADGISGDQTVTAMANYFRLFNHLPREGVVDKYEDKIKALEGDYHHTDTVGKATSPFGVDKTTHADTIAGYAAQKNKKVSALSKKDYLNISRTLFNDFHKELTNSSAKFRGLNKKQQFAVTSAKYNTGTTYNKWIDAFSAFNKKPTVENLGKVVAEARRYETHDGVETYTKGLDNRAVRELRSSGVIDPNNIAHQKILTEHLPKWDSKKL